jgi:hypothetical protein
MPNKVLYAYLVSLTILKPRAEVSRLLSETLDIQLAYLEIRTALSRHSP